MEAAAPKKQGKGGKGGKGKGKGKGEGGKGGKGKRKRDADGEEKKWQQKSILAEGGEGPANKKRALRQQRAATKPNFEAVTAAKVLWNELREKKCPAARRAELCDELHAALTGKYREVALKHDASRLVQAIVQFGSDAQRATVLEECSAGGSGSGGGFVELCRSPYAHYVVIKLVEQCRTKDAHRKLAASLAGHVVQLATHGVAARVIELALGSLKGAAAASLKLELYGREFTVFASDLTRDLALHRQREQVAAAAAHAQLKCSSGGSSDKSSGGKSSSGKSDGDGEDASATGALPPVSARPTLAAMLAVRPERSEAVLTQVGAVVAKLVRKGLLAFQFAHELVGEYLDACPSKQFEEVAPAAVENALVLLSTRAGARAVCTAARRGGAKERRRLLKLLKGHAAALLTHRDAYLAVLALCECTDDTVALQKGLLAELCVAPTAEELLAEKTLAANPYADDEGEGDEEGEEDGEGEGDGEEEDEGEEDGEDGEDEEDGEDGEDEEGNDEENAMREDDDEDEEKEGGDDAKASPKKARTALKGVAASAASTEVERAAPLLAVALSPNGAKLLLRVLSAGDPKHLDPLEVELLALPAEASKKDPQVRRDELLAFLADPILSMLAQHPALLLQSRSGGAVATAALQCLAGSGSSLVAEAAAALAAAVAAAVAAGGNSSGGDEAAVALAEDPVAHATLKRALLAEADAEKAVAKSSGSGSESGGSGSSSASPLASALAAQTAAQLSRWVGGPNGSFVAWALLQVPSAASALVATNKLRAVAAALAAAVNQPEASKGQALAAAAVAALLGGGSGGGAKKTAAKAPPAPAAAASAEKAPKTPKAASQPAAAAKAAAATAKASTAKTPVRGDGAKTPKRAATASKAEGQSGKEPSPAGVTRSMRKKTAGQ